MQEKSADCGKNGTFLVESQKQGGRRTGRRGKEDSILLKKKKHVCREDCVAMNLMAEEICGQGSD